MKETLERRLEIKRIVLNAGLYDDPGFYTGPGVIRRVDGNQVSKISAEIRKKYGKNASDQFIQMFVDIPDTYFSPIYFLTTLYKLADNDYIWDKSLMKWHLFYRTHAETKTFIYWWFLKESYDSNKNQLWVWSFTLSFEKRNEGERTI